MAALSMPQPGAASPLLEVRGLNVTFRGGRHVHHAVRNLDFSVAAGETLALVGESGCGKSTTALSLLRLTGPNAQLSGEISFQGRDILALPPAALRQLRGRDMAMIFQEPMSSLNPVHPVGDQVAEALLLHESLSHHAARQRTVELLDLVGIPEPQRRARDYPHQLSGGQRQRVMIAMAVACRPRLLVADEPTTALDASVQSRILELLDQLRRTLSMGLLLITHDLGVVSQWADRVVVMLDGEKVEEGVVEAVMRAPVHPYTRGLLGASLHAGRDAHYRQGGLPEIRRHVEPGDASVRFELTTPQWVRGIRPSAPAAPLLSVEGLDVRYTGRDGKPVDAVRQVSFTLAPGEAVGLVGESGCGKSSLSRALMKLVPASAGRIVLAGTDLAPLSDAAMRPWRRQMQMVFQDPYSSFNPRRTVHEALDAVLRVQGERDRRQRARRIVEALSRVSMPTSAAGRYLHEFSGGQRQRLAIARALILRPQLVVLDEPVSALDVSVQAQILNLLVMLKEAEGLSYLFISHDLSVVRYLSDRVMVMQAGRIVETGTPDVLWRAPGHPYTQELLAAASTGRRS